MRFEHLIEINDPNNPVIPPLTRAQLWAGLKWRVDDPMPFLPGLEKCRVIAEDAGGLCRQLDFGAAIIEDRVTMQDGHWVRFDILPGPSHAGGSLTIAIEEPLVNALFLRFTYETNLAESGSSLEDSAYVEYVKSAYHHSDVDTVRIIRARVSAGTLQ